MSDTKGFNTEEILELVKPVQSKMNEFPGGFKLTKSATRELFSIILMIIGLVALGFEVPYSGWVLFLGCVSWLSS